MALLMKEVEFNRIKIVSEGNIDPYEAHDSQVYELGDMWIDPNGAKFIYSYASTAIVRGYILTPSNLISIDTVNSDGITRKRGGKSYLADAVIIAGETLTPGQYKNSFMYVDAGTGANQFVEIDDNDADLIYLESALSTSLAAADSDITGFSPNVVKPVPVNDVEAVVGVSRIAVSSGQYFWRQVSGVAPVYIKGNLAGKNGYGVGLISSHPAGAAILISADNTGMEDGYVFGQLVEGGGINRTSSPGIGFVTLNLGM